MMLIRSGYKVGYFNIVLHQTFTHLSGIYSGRPAGVERRYSISSMWIASLAFNNDIEMESLSLTSGVKLI